MAVITKISGTPTRGRANEGAEQSALTYDMLEIMHIPQKCRGTNQRERQQKGENGDSEGVERGVERELCVARRHLLHYFLPYFAGAPWPGYICILHCALPSGLPTILFVLSLSECVCVCCVCLPCILAALLNEQLVRKSVEQCSTLAIRFTCSCFIC